MHLGFHIYDVGFQSPDSEAAKPMVFATTFLLILLVVVMNLTAILIRNHVKKKILLKRILTLLRMTELMKKTSTPQTKRHLFKQKDKHLAKRKQRPIKSRST